MLNEDEESNGTDQFGPFLAETTQIIHSFFFFNDTATTEIYTLSLHDALPIWLPPSLSEVSWPRWGEAANAAAPRSEEHTSELQSRGHLVCRLLLEKKKTT